MDGALGQLAGQLGPWALLVLIILAFMSGEIVPGRPARKEAEAWRQAFFAEQEMRRDLEATGRVVRTAFRALPEAPPEET